MAHTFTIFGASGDLTGRKLIPALYQLSRKKRLPADTRIVGFSRTPFTHEAWRSQLAESVAKFAGKDFSQPLWTEFSQRIFYHAGDIGQPADFDALAKFLDELEKDPNSTRIYYLASLAAAAWRRRTPAAGG